jgi:hypothetical protein
MTRILNINHRLNWYVSHIEDDLTALKVSKALANCTPAHALMELVRNDGVDLGQASTAYKAQYSNRKNWVGWTLACAEQAEYEFERIHDI